MCNKGLCGCMCSLIIGIIGGIIIGIAYFFLASTLSLPTILWTAFGLAVLELVSLIYILNNKESDNKKDKCICKYGNCILIGVIGTLIFELILAVITVGTVVTAILIGIAGLFFVIAIVSLIKLIFCLINASCRKNSCMSSCIGE